MSCGIGQHAADLQPQDLRELVLPLAHERLAGGDHRLLERDLHGQDAEARGIGVGHHLGHRREIDLERIDVQVGQADLAGQPLGERLQVQDAARVARVLPLLLGDEDQRVGVAAAQMPGGEQRIGCGLLGEAVGDQVAQDIFEQQAAVGLPRRCDDPDVRGHGFRRSPEARRSAAASVQPGSSAGECKAASPDRMLKNAGQHFQSPARPRSGYA